MTFKHIYCVVIGTIILVKALIGSTEIDFPPECEEYLILDDSTRNVKHVNGPYYCDSNDRPGRYLVNNRKSK